eukprot:scaffold6524_cov69-Isochrysis_galbana.AAC.1
MPRAAARGDKGAASRGGGPARFGFVSARRPVQFCFRPPRLCPPVLFWPPRPRPPVLLFGSHLFDRIDARVECGCVQVLKLGAGQGHLEVFTLREGLDLHLGRWAGR